MTDTPTTEPDTDAAAEEQDAAPDDTDTEDEQGQTQGKNSEAARYRRRLRDTEAERDALKSRLEVLQRGEVERLISDRFADPADIWRDGATLESLLTDDGNIDPMKVNTLATGLLETHRHWGITKTDSRGLRSGATGPQPRKNGFAQAFKPPGR